MVRQGMGVICWEVCSEIIGSSVGGFKVCPAGIGFNSKADALKALEEITGWLEALRDHAGEFKLDHQVAVLGLLDEAAQPYVRKLQRDYFLCAAINKFQENRLWGA